MDDLRIHDYTTPEDRDLVRQKTEDEARAALEEVYGEVLDTAQLRDRYELHSFMAPFAKATRLSDGAEGVIQFTHHPRFYYGFQEDR